MKLVSCGLGEVGFLQIRKCNPPFVGMSGVDECPFPAEFFREGALTMAMCSLKPLSALSKLQELNKSFLLTMGLECGFCSRCEQTLRQ